LLLERMGQVRCRIHCAALSSTILDARFLIGQ
jgi:hypothetical protein